MSNVRLTQMVKSAGCAAKIFPHILSDALKGIDWYTNDKVLVGFDGKDDAGVYKISDELALILTTDFFTPVVDDPYTYGQIAATNALSDIYAMGGTPINGLNIVAFPQTEELTILKDILRGGADKMTEARAPIIGGHSVDIENILYGLAVTGTIDPKDLKTNAGAKPGNILILTKALGTGLLNNCVKYSELDEIIYNGLITSMTTLNKTSSELMVKFNASACTDITGFGLAGHAMQMAMASNVALRIKVSDIPVLEGAMDAIEKKLWTRGDKSNRVYTQDNVINEGNINEDIEHMLYDPQTSGGLLISVPVERSEELLLALKDNGVEKASIVGSVEEGNGKLIFEFE
ncbi:MAG: selenide, water dikinase SelD [Ignavibacteriae bacterium]|nr:selenide, water dikinase SelD [Ignavibacteriota bacterium]MCB9242902.1 selenide, water dikinase SelD [Ignavibacteriales bacterium]